MKPADVRPAADADVLVAGAGLSGLSLAVHWARSGKTDRHLTLLEPRESYGWDRTWCFWDCSRHPFETAVRHRWSAWSVVAKGRRVERSTARYAYCHIPSPALYEQALTEIDASDQVDLVQGVAVTGLRADDRGVRVATTKGALRARLVLDSRPPARPASHDGQPRVSLLQHFVGLRVEAETPVFDPTCVTLMDFDVDQSRGIHFMYVLPFDRHRALVEDTYFAASPLATEVYVEAIHEYLGRRYGLDAFREVGRERGTIPMTVGAARPPRHPRIIDLGLRGGLARPATGYAFLAIQRSSAELVKRLSAPVPHPPAPRPTRTLFLDGLFLAYLKRHPERAPGLFGRLFERVDADVLARFLSESGGWLDDLKVIKALPARPMMVQALRMGPFYRPGP